MWSYDQNDRYLDDISTIKFKQTFQDQIERWNLNKKQIKQNYSNCYRFLKLGDLLQRSLKTLAINIRRQRVMYLNFLDQLQLKYPQMEEVDENYTLVTFLKTENQRFKFKFDQNSNHLSPDWLLDQIFNKNTQFDVAIDLISTLECVKLKGSFSQLRSQDWSVYYDDNIISRASTMTSQQFSIFVQYIAMIHCGIFCVYNTGYSSANNVYQTWRLSPSVYFSIDFMECLFIDDFNSANYVVGSILPCQVPQLKKNADGIQTLVSFQYKQFFMLHDIKGFEVQGQKPQKNIQKHAQMGDQFAKSKKNNNTKNYYEDLDHDPRLDRKYSEFQSANKLPEFTNTNYFTHERLIYHFSQTLACRYTSAIRAESISTLVLRTLRVQNDILEQMKVQSSDVSSYVFDESTRSYRHKDFKECLRIFDQITHEDTTRQFGQDKKQIQALGNEKNAPKILKILKQIPTLDIQLSELQQAVVSSGKELLCLGRSGTGKTTCSILRLFSQEIMFITLKKHAKLQQLEKQDGVQRKLRLEASDLEQPCNMRTVFISASPVLVNEVSRYYQKLKESLIQHLKKTANGEQHDSASDQYKELVQIAQLEADEIAEEMASQQQLDMPNAFEDLKPQHFPLFVTVKQLLHMMDASLSQSFFCRDGKNNLIAMQNNLSWHNENKGMFMINQQYRDSTNYDELLLKYSDELLLDIDLDNQTQVDQGVEQRTKAEKESYYTRYKTNEDHSSRRWDYQDQQLSFEVDFDIFETRFYTRFMAKNQKIKQNKLSSAMIWTEIFSVIKGSLASNDYYEGHLRYVPYMDKYANKCLNKQEKRIVYWIFLEYEKWKSEQKAFDLMDLVQHIRRSSKFMYKYYYSEMRIDYLMIDEVQDLTPRTLELLLYNTNNKAYFAGDTAQTIAKGVGARFSDLSSLFKDLGTQVIQLTTNYRSHGQILQLANSVVGLLETLFPFSIDRLKKETSNTTGMKPLILMPMPDHTMKKIFLGADKFQVHVTTAHNTSKPQFGCNQVVIVRDQDQKQTLPDIFENMLCLTVYEAKGLEFDDVVLYNFFNCGHQDQLNWKILNEIQFVDYEEAEQVDNIIDELECVVVEEEKSLFEKKMVQKSKMSLENIYRKYALLCVDLKYLYVAITRPKKRLIIYDSDAQRRQPIQRIWETLGLVNVLNSTMIEQQRVPEEIQSVIDKGCMSEESSISTASDWKIQGLKFFKKKQFDQAKKCFSHAGETDLLNKCDAYQLADQGTEFNAQADALVFKSKYLKGKSKQIKAEKRENFKQALQLRTEGRKLFEKAGSSFEKCSMLTHAASCFFTAKNFTKAAQNFQSLGQYGQAAECLMQQRNVSSEDILKAADYFEKAGLITNAIECLERIGAWEQLLLLLHSTRNGLLKEADRQVLSKKYIPIALNKLYSLLSHQETVCEQNMGVQAELKIRQKYQVEKIEEEEYLSEQSSEEQEQDQEVLEQEEQKQEFQGSDEEDIDQATKELFESALNLKKKKSLVQEEVKLEQEKQEVKQEQEKQDDNQSYEILDDSDHEQRNFGSEFEHLSNYDPDDEFLQSQHSIVLINSIISNKDLDQTSEYSVIEDDDDIISLNSRHTVSSSRSIRLIKAQKQTEDLVVRKIIYYIGLFSQQVRDLLSTKDIKENEINLQNLDKNFIQVVLGVLERYDLIKLCLILCNRFQLNERLGQYVVSSCIKYQNLNGLRYSNNFDSFRKTDSVFLNKQRKSALIAHEAMHNVLGLVSSKYLKLKQYDETLTHDNSLGIENYRLILSLGFWKKLVYILNGSLSLRLCLKFNDVENFTSLKDKFSDSKLLDVWYQIIIFKQAITIVDRCINRNNSSLYKEPYQRFSLIEQQITDELNMNRCLEIQLIRDLLDTVKFLILPDSSVANQTKGKQTINLINAGKINNQDQKTISLRNQVIEQASKTFNRVFSSLSNNDLDKINQYLIAFCILYRGACKLQMLNLNEKVLKTLAGLFLTASNSIGKTDLITTALYAAANLHCLDSDYYNGELVENDDQNLFLHFQDTHVLASIHSPAIFEVQSLQKRLNNSSLKEQFIIQGSDTVNESEPSQITKKLQQLRDKLKENSRLCDVENLRKPKQLSTLIVDMDLQFLMVPKSWVDNFVIVRLNNQIQSVYRQLSSILKTTQLQAQSWMDIYQIKSQILNGYVQCNKYNNLLFKKMTDVNVESKLQQLVQQLDRYVLKKLCKVIDVTKDTEVIKQKQKIERLIISAEQYCQIISYQGTLKLNNYLFSQSTFEIGLEVMSQLNEVTFLEHFNYFLINSINFFSTTGLQDNYFDLLRQMYKKEKEKTRRQLIKANMHNCQAQRLLKMGQVTEGCKYLVKQYNQSAHLIESFNALDIIESAFYTLAALFGDVILPEQAMHVLDTWYKLDTEKQRAMQQLGIQGEDVYNEPEDDYYSEWDRPEISQVKEIQLSKRPSQQDQKILPLLQYQVERQDLTYNNKDQTQIFKQLLNMILVQFKHVSNEEFDEETSHRLFNMVVALCVNVDVRPFNQLLKQFFQMLERSPLSDYYYQILLQYTEEPTQLKNMFQETDDEYKYSFFAGEPFVVHIIAKVKNECAPTKLNFETWLYQRDKARKIIKLQLQKIADLKVIRAYDKDVYQQLGIDQKIFEIKQNLPNVENAVQALKDLQSIQLNLMELLIQGTSQKIKNSQDISFVIQTQVEVLDSIKTLVGHINQFVQSKSSILSSFADLGDVDGNLKQFVDKAYVAAEYLDCKVQIWYQCCQAKAEKEEKGDESNRAQRMMFKWQTWNNLAQRRNKLLMKLDKLKNNLK